jgi:NAD(P)-dependent dehydrogenase (short-subunit alcohol dehydrogenase family)
LAPVRGSRDQSEVLARSRRERPGRLFVVGQRFNLDQVAPVEVEGLTDSLALELELEPFGVSIFSVQPGAIKSEWAAIAADRHTRAVAGGITTDRRFYSVMRRLS